MKICYVIESMYNSGGMERVLSVCANALSKEFDISILTLYQNGRDYFFPVEDSILKHNLGLENVLNKKELQSRLSSFLMSHHFNIVVSLGGIDMYYLHSIKDGSKKMIWFHFAIDIAKTTWAGPNPTLINKLKANIQTRKRIYHAKKYDNIIVISKADLKEWKKFTDKVSLIYNPITINNNCLLDGKQQSVITVGRLDFQKGYDYLIDAWDIVAKKHPDWHLDIYGDGPLRNNLQIQIDSLNLNRNISLCGRTSNIDSKYPLYSFFVMSSRAEGLGLVLLEAAFCGLPLISFDCPSGPSEIIENGKNGFLIQKVGDIEGLADAINKLIEDDALRDKMGQNAVRMIEKFSINNISEQWIKLFKE